MACFLPKQFWLLGAPVAASRSLAIIVWNLQHVTNDAFSYAQVLLSVLLSSNIYTPYAR